MSGSNKIEVLKSANKAIWLGLITIGLVIGTIIFWGFESGETQPEVLNWCATSSDEDTYRMSNLPKVFLNNCASCHFIDKDMTGPAIKGITERMPYDNWFYNFITNEDSLIDAKEPYTLMLNEEWLDNIDWNHTYKNLSEEDLVVLESLTY